MTRSRRNSVEVLTQGVLLASMLLGVRWTVTAAELELAGVTVTPHFQLESMRYQRKPEPADGARVQLFLRHEPLPGAIPLVIRSDSSLRFAGKTPAELLKTRAWAWHDTPAAMPGTKLELPSGALTVWTFNGRRLPFGVGGEVALQFGPADHPWLATNLSLATPQCWISAATFLGPEDSIQPDTLVIHLENAGVAPVEIRSCRLWLPANAQVPEVLFPQPTLTNLVFFGGQPGIPAGDKGGFTLHTPPLPLTYCALEVTVARRGEPPFSLWTHLRIKPERFDISGGWVNDGATRHERVLSENPPAPPCEHRPPGQHPGLHRHRTLRALPAQVFQSAHALGNL